MKQFENVDLPLKVRQLSFLEDLVEYYNTSNRCEVNGRCRYSPIEISEGCAIGRHLLWDKCENPKDFDSKVGFAAYIEVKKKSSFKEIMPDWMESLEDSFLMECQDLHDDEDHWDLEGLSSYGRNVVKYMKRNINL